MQATAPQRGREAGVVALLACSALLGCAVQPVEVHVAFQLGAAEERAVLLAAFPRAILLQLGGLPDPYPAAAPRVVLDLQWVQRAKVDFAAASIKPGPAGVRVSGLRAKAAGALSPAPSELRVYGGPPGASSVSGPGVLLLARGAWVPDGVQHELVLEPDAPHDLAALVAGGALQVLLAAQVPYDTRLSPAAPTGTASADLYLELEILP